MARIDNMIATLAREVQRLNVEVVHTETADARHAVVVTDQPPKEAAVKLSKALPGCIFIGGAHIAWTCSNFAVALHTIETWEKLKQVRAVTESITGDRARFGTGACARQLIAWLGPPQPANPRLRTYVGDWHYQRCIPCEIEDAYQFDLAACYFNLLLRLPSLYPAFTDDEIFWCCTPDTEAERFARLISGVAHVKQLRNAIVGAMYGGSQSVFLKAGKPQRFKTAPGARAAIATVIVRTAYEVCQLQAELCDAAYANTDSIISAESVPGFWRDLGLPYTLSARGAADVQGIGKYKVGDKRTKNYLNHNPNITPRRESRRVDPIYWRWLTASKPLLG